MRPQTQHQNTVCLCACGPLWASVRMCACVGPAGLWGYGSVGLCACVSGCFCEACVPACLHGVDAYAPQGTAAAQE